MSKGTLIIFVKAPLAGRVKTRLGRDIGMGRAAVLFRHLTKRVLDEAEKGPWRAILAIDPLSELHSNFPAWSQSCERVAQTPGDLGARMKSAMAAVPCGPVVIVGADAPGLRAGHVREAFHALGRADAVFGPAEDGGYWLAGLARRRAAPRLFENVRWSSRHALADTVRSLPANFRIRYLSELRDVDDAADLRIAGPILRSAR